MVVIFNVTPFLYHHKNEMVSVYFTFSPKHNIVLWYRKRIVIVIVLKIEEWIECVDR